MLLRANIFSKFTIAAVYRLRVAYQTIQHAMHCFLILASSSAPQVSQFLGTWPTVPLLFSVMCKSLQRLFGACSVRCSVRACVSLPPQCPWCVWWSGLSAGFPRIHWRLPSLPPSSVQGGSSATGVEGGEQAREKAREAHCKRPNWTSTHSLSSSSPSLVWCVQLISLAPFVLLFLIYLCRRHRVGGGPLLSEGTLKVFVAFAVGGLLGGRDNKHTDTRGSQPSGHERTQRLMRPAALTASTVSLSVSVQMPFCTSFHMP